MKAYLILEDGNVFEGESVGANKEVVSEFVFNTSMTGYVEVLTDPSYAGQSVVMTYPLIGNYGVCLEDQESTKPYVEGFVVNRAANAAIYLAEHDSDPSHLITFLEKMYAEDFQPEESSNYKSVSDDQIKEQMIASGVSEDVADKAFGRDYQDWLDAIDTYTPKRSELWNTSGTYKDSMTTPTVTINGKFWDMNQLSTAQETIEEGLLEAIGIKSDDIGKEGVMPSIGSDKDPISNTTGE